MAGTVYTAAIADPSQPAPAPWPDPVWSVVDDRESAQGALARLVGATALGVSVDLRHGNTRLRAGDDPRGARLHAVALAREGPSKDGAEGASVLILEGPALAEVPGLWSGPTPPYLVFAHAQIDLALVTGSRPQRFGCVTTAATLLAEGADRQRDHRPLDGLVRAWLDRDLPESLLGTSAHARLASEAQALLGLMAKLTPKLRDAGLARVFRFECELVPAVLDMEAVGLGFDAARFERLASSWQRERDTLEPDASARIARLDKLISTYRWWARDHAAGSRIRCRLHPLATDTGRFACSEPNLQQVPSEHTAPGFRACFGPAPGHVLVVADYAQIELRVAAHLAPCEAMRAVFRAGRDPHRATAATLAGKPEHAIDDHERKLAKAINFGFLFGMGAERFRTYAKDAYGLELEPRESVEAREAFFRTFPGIAAWHRRVAALGARARREPITVHTMMGRRRTFPVGTFSFNAALNVPVQGTAAEGFKSAMLRLHRDLPHIGGRGVMIVHDEYLAEIPESRAEEGRVLVERIMVEAMRELVDSLPILVESRITRVWD